VQQPAPFGRLADTSRAFGSWRGADGALTYSVAHYICVHSDLAARSVGDASSARARSRGGSRVNRLARVAFSWRGGQQGLDRPLDRAFVSVQRLAGRGRWTAVANDLGYQILWTIDSNGVYRAIWQVPLDASAGRYRFLITANRYKLASHSFTVAPSRSLTLQQVRSRRGWVAVRLGYPPAMLASELDTDLNDRPANADGGIVTFRIGRRAVSVRRGRGAIFAVRVPGRNRVRVLRAFDRYGNTASSGLKLGR
jgi:hypothetical protein